MTSPSDSRMLDLGAVLESIRYEVQPHFGKGRVVRYIPALKRISANKFGIAVALTDGREFSVGDASEAFSIQSISKLFTLMLAMSAIGDEVWRRVGKEPSGTAFNSLVQLEYEGGIPRNPFVNAGALVDARLRPAAHGRQDSGRPPRLCACPVAQFLSRLQ